jgi:hypothetical protein
VYGKVFKKTVLKTFICTSDTGHQLLLISKKIKPKHDKKRNMVDDADAGVGVLFLGLRGR